MVTCAQVGDSDRFPLCMRGLGSLVSVNDAVVIVVSKEVLMGQQVSVGRQYWAGLALGRGPSHRPLARG